MLKKMVPANLGLGEKFIGIRSRTSCFAAGRDSSRTLGFAVGGMVALDFTHN